MRFALVFNPFSYKLHEENLRIVQKYFGLFPPLSLAWVAAIAERAGHQCIIVDARTTRLSREETLEILRQFRPDIIGFMMTTYMFRETLEWARFLKEHLRVPVLVGGYNLRVYPRESVADPTVDFGCLNSAYYTVPALFEVLEHGGRLDEVPGLSEAYGQLSTARSEPSNAAWFAGRKYLEEGAIQRVMRGKAEPAEALARTAEKIDNEIESEF